METSKAYFEDILDRFETERRGRKKSRSGAVNPEDNMSKKTPDIDPEVLGRPPLHWLIHKLKLKTPHG